MHTLDKLTNPLDKPTQVLDESVHELNRITQALAKITQMLSKTMDVLAGVPVTVVAGVFLALDFVPQASRGLGFTVAQSSVFPIDPAWITVLLSGLPLVYQAVCRLVNSSGIAKISSDLLISIAMAAAVFIGDLFAAGEVAWIMAIGAILEDRTVARAKKGLGQLISLAPAQGRRLTDNREELIPADIIGAGDVLRILPGETIPADGIIVSGETSINQAIMTGESLPVDKVVGDHVYCGTINCFGSIDIRATHAGNNSSLQKLIRLVQEAEHHRAPMASLADRAASWLVPLALLTAVITGLFTGELVRAVTVLVVFCPCALVLATPTAVMAAIGQATKHGVVIKSGAALETMGKIDTLALDKTGTLTYGRLQVSDVISVDATISQDELLALTAAAEAKSEHPLARAIVAGAQKRCLPRRESTAFAMEAGKGISAEVAGLILLCGTESYLREKGASIGPEARTTLDQLREQGKAVVLVAQNGVCVGVLALSDVVRPEAKLSVERLHQLHTDVVLLTGDHWRTAEHFARHVGIEQVRAQLLPEDKVNNIRAMQGEGRRVGMVGDGVNDAPALKTADVGIALGGLGSDIAAEAADIVLMNDDISRLPYLKRLAEATVNTIVFSISLSMTINLVAVTLSVLGILTPTLGALVHNAGSCFVVLIAALLYDRRFD